VNAPMSAPKPLRTVNQELAKELRACVADLRDVVDHVIGSRDMDDFALEHFRDALLKTNGVRLMLSTEADKLDPQPAVAS
jgi:hypothetical protein